MAMPDDLTPVDAPPSPPFDPAVQTEAAYADARTTWAEAVERWQAAGIDDDDIHVERTLDYGNSVTVEQVVAVRGGEPTAVLVIRDDAVDRETPSGQSDPGDPRSVTIDSLFHGSNP